MKSLLRVIAYAIKHKTLPSLDHDYHRPAGQQAFKHAASVQREKKKAKELKEKEKETVQAAEAAGTSSGRHMKGLTVDRVGVCMNICTYVEI